jgi:S-adenosylmethionine:tRNA ribosyltransferase-isomerase
MKISDFDYELPKNLIATEPMNPRDHSRLLLLDKKTGDIEHKQFLNIVDYLNKGDVLVMNNSKVFPARLEAFKETGGKMEVMLHKRQASDYNYFSPPSSNGETKRGSEVWQVMIGGRGAQVGKILNFSDEKFKAEIIKNNEDGTWDLKFNMSGSGLMDVVERIGEVPIPPYIKKQRDSIAPLQSDSENYQTVYADSEKLGSVAAPTAGFHFTPELLNKIKEKGVIVKYVTLHVGLGTFAPIKSEKIEDHQIHSEYIEMPAETLEEIRKAKKEKRRVIAVGTTSVRTLESFSKDIRNYNLEIRNSLSRWTEIYIYPGYKFQIVDAMTTNFHLPKSSLLLLVSAFAGKEYIDKAYQDAIKNNYRFYSYGDAMFIY